MNKLPQPQSNKEVVSTWKKQLHELKEKDDTEVAYNMVATLAGNEWWDSLEEKNAEDPLISEVFEIAANLELPNGVTEVGSQDDREAAWGRVKEIVEELEDKYLEIE